MMKKTILTILAACALSTGANAQLIFTQYYEGTSFNKYVEIKNIGTTDIDLTGFSLSLWSNGNREGWKTGGAATTNTALSGSLLAGGVIVFSHPDAVSPAYADAIAVAAAAVNFNGDDSLVLWSGSTYSTSAIIDALSFSSNTGADKSFVRLSLDAGYNLTAGSSIMDFPSVWQQVSLGDVDGATEETDNRLGYSSLDAIPEPSTYALLAIGGVAFVVFMRRRETLVSCS